MIFKLHVRVTFYCGRCRFFYFRHFGCYRIYYSYCIFKKNSISRLENMVRLKLLSSSISVESFCRNRVSVSDIKKRT